MRLLVRAALCACLLRSLSMAFRTSLDTVVTALARTHPPCLRISALALAANATMAVSPTLLQRQSAPTTRDVGCFSRLGSLREYTLQHRESYDISEHRYTARKHTQPTPNLNIAWQPYNTVTVTDGTCGHTVQLRPWEIISESHEKRERPRGVIAFEKICSPRFANGSIIGSHLNCGRT